MNLSIVNLAVTTALTAALVATPAFAQLSPESEQAAHSIEKIVVTASPFEQKLSDAANCFHRFSGIFSSTKNRCS